jgi:hypothetical protein
MKEVTLSLLQEIANFAGAKFGIEYLERLLPAIRENFRIINLMDQLNLDKSIEPSSYLALLLENDNEEL